jgi:hypothetical protein
MGAAIQGEAKASLLSLTVEEGMEMRNSLPDAQFKVDRERLSAPAPFPRTTATDFSAVSVSQMPDDPGAAARYTVKFRPPNELLAGKDLIIFTLDEEFYVPDNLNVNQISISADQIIGGTSPSPGQSVAPLDVTVDFSGAKSNKPEIALTVPDMDPSDGTGWNHIANDANVIVILRQSAGIENPTESGTDPFKIRVSNNGVDPGAAGDTKIDLVTPSIVELSSTSDPRGNSVTAVAKGFDGGSTVTFWRDADGDGVQGSGEIDLCSAQANGDNIASCDFTVHNPPFVKGAGNDCAGTFTDNSLDEGSLDGCNYINARDEESRTASQRDQDDLDRQILNLEGLVSASPDDGDPGDIITIQLKDYPPGALVGVNLAGVNIPTNADGAAITNEIVTASGDHNFTIEIPDGVPPGAQTLTVKGQGGVEEDIFIVVGGATLVPFPTTVVPNQRISLSGTGFTKGGLATINDTGEGSSITIGGEVIHPSRINGGRPIKIDNGGSWSTFIDLPVTSATVTEGPRELKVTDSDGRQGTGEITFQERQITVVPGEGGVGDNVTVNGQGFAAQNDHGNRIAIKVSYAAAGAPTNTSIVTPDSSGNWTADLRVPRDAPIPSTNTVMAEFDLFQAASPDTKSGKAAIDMVTHQVPRAQITLDRVSGPPGTRVTLTAQGFEQFTLVDALTIGNVNLTPSPAPSTDGNGSTSFEFVVPGLDTGIQTVQLQVEDTTASLGFSVTDNSSDETPSIDFDVVLNNISDKLERAFLFNNLSKDWQFFDARKEFAGANTLTQVPSGATLWLKVTQDVQFGINGHFFDLTCTSPDADEDGCWNSIVVPHEPGPGLVSETALPN